MSRQVSAGPADQLSPGTRKLIFVDGRSIVVFNIDGTLRAIDNSCPHNGASLANGRLDGHMLRCPAHGLGFDLSTGCTKDGGLCLKSFPVQSVGAEVVLDLDD